MNAPNSKTKLAASRRVNTSLKSVERRPSLQQSVQTAIKEFIIENQLQPGDALPSENDLAKNLNVSRNIVREAVKSLSSLGIVETRHGRGLFVRPFSFIPILDNLAYGLGDALGELADLLEIRRALETGMIGRAIQEISDSQLEGLRDIIEQMSVLARKGEGFAAEDREFHRRLYEPLGNKALLKLLDIFWMSFRVASQNSDIRDIKPMSTYRDHVAILEALAARDNDKSRIALNRHYDALQERLERVRAEKRPVIQK